MSNTHRICVCGKERKNKQPVIITITTCRHKHAGKEEGSFFISTEPLSTCSPTEVSSTDKSNKTEQPEHTEETSNKNIQQVHPEDKTSLATNDTSVYEPALENLSTTSPNNETAAQLISNEHETFEAVQEPETIVEEVKENTEITETGENDIAKPSENEMANDDVQEADNPEATEDSDPDANNPTVMMLTETAVNTMPFLDNLFWSRNATESTPNLLSDDDQVQEDNNKCSIELLVFEKHSKECRSYVRKLFNNEESFYDGDSFFEGIGRLSFPTCSDEINKDDLTDYLRTGDHKTNAEKRMNLYNRIFKTVENHLRSKQFYENPNINFQKYISLAKDSDSNGEFYLKKVTTDRSVQFDSNNLSDTSKWYDVFLMCLGLKSQNICDIDDINKELMPRRTESSHLVTKYLKV